MLRFDSHYKLKLGDNIGKPETLNARFQDLDLRVGAQEDIEKTWQDAIAVLQTMGVDQVNEALFPVFQHIQNLANLGSIFRSTASTEIIIGKGLRTLFVNEDDRGSFAAAAYVAGFVQNDLNKAILGRTVSYDNVSGELVINVDRCSSEGQAGANWVISAASATDNAEAATQAAASANIALNARDAAILARNTAVSAQGDVSSKALNVAADAASVTAAKNIVIEIEDTITTLHGEVIDNIESLNALYLGTHASDPTQTNTGDPLATGMMYWNSTAHDMRVYDGSVPGFMTAYNTSTSSVDSFNGRTGGVNPVDGDYTAAQIVVTPSGNISQTRVAGALSGLDGRITALEGGINGGTF